MEEEGRESLTITADDLSFNKETFESVVVVMLAATAADQVANLAELSYAREKAVEADKRGREEMARLQRRQQEQRAAERQLQQQQQQQQQQQDGEGTEMRNLGASPSSQSNTSERVHGELT